MKEFRINEYLTLKLEYYDTYIYIKNKRFIQCKRLILNIPKENIKQYKKIESIDEATSIYERYVIDNVIYRDGNHGELEVDEEFQSEEEIMSPEEEFWGHCSNLQLWAEHDYDTRLLRVNLAFPLLHELAKVGDKKARAVFKEEIAKRLSSGYKPVIDYLFEEGYLNYLNSEELLTSLIVPEEAEVLLELERELNIVFKYVPDFNRSLGNKYHSKIPRAEVVRILRQNPEINSQSIPEMEDAVRDFYRREKEKYRKFTVINKHVIAIDLMNCGITKIPESLSNLKFLEKLVFILDPIKEIPKTLSDLKYLKFLSLDRCGLERLPQEIAFLDSIEELDLYGNNLLEISSDLITSLISLKKLNLRGNPISYKNIRQLEEKGIEILYS